MRRAVFVFEGHDLTVYPSTEVAEASVEGYDAENIEAYLDDGTVLSAAAVEHRCRFTATDTRKYDELQARLRRFLAACSLDPSLAEQPLHAAQAIVDADWDLRPFQWWTRLDRRFNEDRPRVGR